MIMNLYIKQKVFSFKDRFNIFDCNGNIRYTAEGELFSLGKKLHIYDNGGNEVIYIRQRLVTFLPKYEISVLNTEPVEIVKNFTLFKHEYSIPAWSIKIHGDFFAHEYTVERNGYVIAHLSKEWLSWGDTYNINIASPEDELTALACILVVDCCMEAQINAMHSLIQ